jgi:HAD superfamily hydrolase (TIGR01509 family)
VLTHVIFDMDGVIIDSEPIYAAVEARLFAELGIVVSDQERAGFVGIPERTVWAHLKQTRGLLPSVDELLTNARDLYAEHVTHHGPEPLVPGVAVLIHRLKSAGFRLAVASSSPPRTIERVCLAHALRPCFDVVVSGDQVARPKPNPDVFLRAAELLGSVPEHCVVIEDSTNGVRAAKAAGMTCIGFRNSHSGKQDLSMADLIVETFGDPTFDRIYRMTGDR